VNGTAVEHSATFTVALGLHKGLRLTWPVLSSPTHMAATAVGRTLEEALAACVDASIDLLIGYSGGRLTREEAYTLSSIAVDFRIAAAVNGDAVVYGSIPRDIFSRAA
jgi:acetamidase/formamidase